MSDFSGLALFLTNFKGNEHLKKLFESTIQLWTFLLNISKVRKKGGVLYFEPFSNEGCIDNILFLCWLSF
jgi:hypothetical protein